MTQLLLHLFGDYITQTSWMAVNKTKDNLAAFCHATVYSLPFLLITNWHAWFVIWSTHLLIDRYRLAKYVCQFKNGLSDEECDPYGYPKETPIWLSMWLLIITDNTIHLIINALSIRYIK